MSLFSQGSALPSVAKPATPSASLSGAYSSSQSMLAAGLWVPRSCFSAGRALQDRRWCLSLATPKLPGLVRPPVSSPPRSLSCTLLMVVDYGFWGFRWARVDVFFRAFRMVYSWLGSDLNGGRGKKWEASKKKNTFYLHSCRHHIGAWIGTCTGSCPGTQAVDLAMTTKIEYLYDKYISKMKFPFPPPSVNAGLLLQLLVLFLQAPAIIFRELAPCFQKLLVL